LAVCDEKSEERYLAVPPLVDASTAPQTVAETVISPKLVMLVCSSWADQDERSTHLAGSATSSDPQGGIDN
jgi:hypothetical protein